MVSLGLLKVPCFWRPQFLHVISGTFSCRFYQSFFVWLECSWWCVCMCARVSLHTLAHVTERQRDSGRPVPLQHSPLWGGTHWGSGKGGFLIFSFWGVEKGFFSVCAGLWKWVRQDIGGQVQDVHILLILCSPPEVGHISVAYLNLAHIYTGQMQDK